jgi:hypothetical protein
MKAFSTQIKCRILLIHLHLRLIIANDANFPEEFSEIPRTNWSKARLRDIVEFWLAGLAR